MPFTSLQGIIDMAERENITIAELMIKREVEQRGSTREEIMKEMSDQFRSMEETIRAGIQRISSADSNDGDGKRLYEYLKNSHTFVSPKSLQAIVSTYAILEDSTVHETRIASFPTITAGILGALFVQVLDNGRFTRDEILKSMFTASALRLVITSIEQESAQPEVWSATALAAGALVELAGGTPKQVGNAVGIALANSWGVVWNQLAGSSTSFHSLHTITALAVADLALAQVVNNNSLSPDELVHRIQRIEEQMPERLGSGVDAARINPRLSDSEKCQLASEYISTKMKKSSHVNGAIRIGNIAHQLLNEQPRAAKFTLMGFYVNTSQRHEVDLAFIAGVLGMEKIEDMNHQAIELAQQHELKFEFTKRVLGSYHPNTVLIELEGESRKVTVVASSLGRGKVEVQEFDGYPLKFSGERSTLIIRHSDRKGVIADVSWIIQEKGFNIARMGNERSNINGPAITICEVDDSIDESLITMLQREIPVIDEIILIQTM